MAYRYTQPLQPFQYESSFVAPPIEFLRDIMDKRQAVYNSHVEKIAQNKAEYAEKDVAPGDLNYRNNKINTAFKDAYDKLNTVDNPNMITDQLYNDIVEFRSDPFWMNAKEKHARYLQAVNQRALLNEKGMLIDIGNKWNDWVNAPSTNADGSRNISEDVGFMEKNDYVTNVKKQLEGLIARERMGDWKKGKGIASHLMERISTHGWKETDRNTLNKLISSEDVKQFLEMNPSWVHDKNYQYSIDQNKGDIEAAAKEFIIDTVIDKSAYQIDIENRELPTPSQGHRGGYGTPPDTGNPMPVFGALIKDGTKGSILKYMDGFDRTGVGRKWDAVHVFSPATDEKEYSPFNMLMPKDDDLPDVAYNKRVLQGTLTAMGTSLDQELTTFKNDNFGNTASYSDVKANVPNNELGKFNVLLKEYVKTGNDKYVQELLKIAKTDKGSVPTFIERFKAIKDEFIEELNAKIKKGFDANGDKLFNFEKADLWENPTANARMQDGVLDNQSLMSLGVYLTGSKAGENVIWEKGQYTFDGITYDHDLGFIIAATNTQDKNAAPVQINVPLTPQVINGIKEHGIMTYYDGMEYFNTPEAINLKKAGNIDFATPNGVKISQTKKYDAANNSPYYTYQINGDYITTMEIRLLQIKEQFENSIKDDSNMVYVDAATKARMFKQYVENHYSKDELNDDSPYKFKSTAQFVKYAKYFQ